MKKKGFTLIELLAVIVILAVIALILIPKVNDIVDMSRKQAYKESVNGIIDSANNYINEYVLEHKDELKDYPVVFTCDGNACVNGTDSLTFKGAVPTSGTIIINESGILADSITNGKYCAYGYKWNLRVEDGCETSVKFYVDGSTIVTKDLVIGSNAQNGVSSPSKDGWLFAGWRSDTVASLDVLSDPTVTPDTNSFYAVFYRIVHLYTTVMGTLSSTEGTQVYNNGNYSNPTLGVADPEATEGATFKGWSNGAGITTISDTSLASGIEISEDTARYAVWQYGSVTLANSLGYTKVNQDSSSTILNVDGTKYASVTLNNVTADCSTGNATTGRISTYVGLGTRYNGTTVSSTTLRGKYLHNANNSTMYEYGYACEGGKSTNVTLSLNPGGTNQVYVYSSSGQWAWGSVSVNGSVVGNGRVAQN